MSVDAGRAWQVVGDCEACRTEGANTEIHAEGVGAIRSTCQVCGRTEEAGEVVQSGLDMRDTTVARNAIDAWARREGLTTGELADGLVGLPLEEIVHRYHTGQPVPTTLDVLAFLFPGMSAGVAPGNVSVSEEALADAPAPERTPDDPRAPARVLVSVMIADGTVSAAERRFVDRFLDAHGMTPLTPDEIRPWRPYELGPVRDRALAEATLKASVELLHLDGVRDGSELRVLHTFARTWGIDTERIDAWDRHYDRHHAPPLRTVWRALSRWVR